MFHTRKGALAILVPFCYDVSHEWAIGLAGRSVWVLGSTPCTPMSDVCWSCAVAP